MKRTILSPADAAWLTSTFARRRSQFQGWRMEDAGDAGGDGGGDPSGDAGAGSGASDQGAGSDDGDKGFPANTRVADMTVEQRANYHAAQARKHEERNRDLLRITGGKYGADLEAMVTDYNRLRTAGLSDADRAVEDAKTSARADVQREYGQKLAAAEFRAALAHVDGERRGQIIEGLNLSAYLTDSGDVDTDKVKSYAEAIAPADKGTGGGRYDHGAGRRGSGARPTGVGAGAEAYRASRSKSTN